MPAESGTVHAHFGSDVVQGDGMDIMRHHVSNDLLHTPHIPVYPHRLAGKCTVGCREHEWQEAEHFTQAPQFILGVHLEQGLAEMTGTLCPKLQGINGKGHSCQPVPYFGEEVNAMLHESGTECHHEIADATFVVRRRGVVYPMVVHGRRYQHHIAFRKRLEGVARHSCTSPLHHVIQFPRLVPVQFGFHADINPLVDEEKRVVVRFRQFVRYNSFFHDTFI